MKTKKIDRRAARSKRLIISAYRELLLEKDHSAITVSDIVDRADIGRATFYAHFEDKRALDRHMFSLLLGQIEMEIEQYLGDMENEQGLAQKLVPSLAIFKIAQDRYVWFKKNGSLPDVGLTMLIDPLVKRLELKLDEIPKALGRNDPVRNYGAIFLVSALINLLVDWIMRDMPQGIEKMDEIYQSLANPTIRKLVGE